MATSRERVSTAQEFYRITDTSFRSLCPDASGHMNMGLWPARTICAAQEALLGLALDRAVRHWSEQFGPGAPRALLDLGSGWGASRALFDRAFPRSAYYGVNQSAEQVAVARSVTQGVPATEYLETAVENLAALPWDAVDVVTAFEAAFHFGNKPALIAACARARRLVVLLELCVENATLARNPLLRPSLRHPWTLRHYEQAFDAVEMRVREVADLTASVLPGFLGYLDGLDLATYRGRRMVFDQLRRATTLLASAAESGDVSYVLLVASTQRPSEPACLVE